MSILQTAVKQTRRAFFSLTAAAAFMGVTTSYSQQSTGSPDATRRKFRVLSLDGGGARGFLTARLLTEIEVALNAITREKMPLGRRFDLIAGTSVGGIIALALSMGKSASDIQYFIETSLREIFAESEQSYAFLRPTYPKYGNGTLGRIVQNFFGNSTLADVETDVCVTAVELLTGQPHFFRSFGEFAASNIKLWDVALATSAAPTYFPARKPQDAGYLIDGGVCANNPAVVAIADALRIEPRKKDISTPRVTDIMLLSIGTGTLTQMPYTDDLDKMILGGYINWGLNISDVMYESQSSLADHQARALLEKGNYRRINSILQFKMRLDDVSKLDDLKSFHISSDDKDFLGRHFAPKSAEMFSPNLPRPVPQQKLAPECNREMPCIQ